MTQQIKTTNPYSGQSTMLTDEEHNNNKRTENSDQKGI